MHSPLALLPVCCLFVHSVSSCIYINPYSMYVHVDRRGIDRIVNNHYRCASRIWVGQAKPVWGVEIPKECASA